VFFVQHTNEWILNDKSTPFVNFLSNVSTNSATRITTTLRIATLKPRRVLDHELTAAVLIEPPEATESVGSYMMSNVLAQAVAQNGAIPKTFANKTQIHIPPDSDSPLHELVKMYKGHLAVDAKTEHDLIKQIIGP